MSQAPRPPRSLWPAIGLLAAVALLLIAYAIARGDPIRYSLGPRPPVQRPPPPASASAAVAAAFRAWRARYGDERPFVLVGVEQGGTLASRLLAEEIAPDPALSRRLAAAYLIETVVSAERPPLAPCRARGQA